jgi:hypothetical protein
MATYFVGIHKHKETEFLQSLENTRHTIHDTGLLFNNETQLEFHNQHTLEETEDWLICFSNSCAFHQINNLQLETAKQLRLYIMTFMSKLLYYANNADCHFKILLCEKLLYFIVLYKPMFTTNTYGFGKLLTKIILKLLEFMSYNGLVAAFLLFCEFCPDMVHQKMCPKFKVPNYTILNLKLENQLERLQHNNLYSALFTKHVQKWNEFILPQIMT